MKTLGWLCALTLSGIAMSGCEGREAAEGSTVPTTTLVDPLYSFSEAELIMGGQELPVEVQVEPGSGREVVLSALLDGAVLEREKYLVTDAAVYFVGFDDDSFEPPIQLFRLPETKDSFEWEWRGSYLTGDFETPARAEISAESGSRTIAGAIHNRALTVRVSLELSQSETGSERFLEFVFVPEQGVIQRNLNDSSVRTLPKEPEDL